MRSKPLAMTGLPGSPLKSVINKELRGLIEREVTKDIPLGGPPGPVYADPENGSFRAAVMSEFENLISTLEMLVQKTGTIASELGVSCDLLKREPIPDMKQIGGFFPDLTDALMRAARAASEIHSHLSNIEKEVSPSIPGRKPKM